jgi:glycerophosphoryl diester phosphodiesterase
MKIISHRGNQKVAFENTLEAILDASKSTNLIEIDVRQIKSGEFILFHDKSLKRVFNQATKLSNMDLSQVKKLKLPGGYEIPTLSEVLDNLSVDIVINIDFKSGEITEMLDLLKIKNKLSFVAISSRKISFLKNLIQTEPEISIGLIRRWPLFSALFHKELNLKFITARTPFHKLLIYSTFNNTQLWVYGFNRLPKHPNPNVGYMVDEI